jgi:hypothetical protein
LDALSGVSVEVDAKRPSEPKPESLIVRLTWKRARRADPSGRGRSGLRHYHTPMPPIATVLQQRLSAARLAPYVAASGGNLTDGVRLYRWNIEMSGAVYEALHVVEVVLRNTLHDCLEEFHRATHGAGSWLDSPPPCLVPRAIDDIVGARQRAVSALRRKATVAGASGPLPTLTPGAVVAELSMGFWRYLLSKRYETDLWRPSLRHGFPHLGRGSRVDVESPVERLHLLRNRIAHLEPIHTENLSARLRDMTNVLGYICPRTQSWFGSVHRIKVVLATKP